MDSGVRLPAPQSTCLHPSPQLFKGKFYHCLGVDTRNITNRSDCVAANYRWVHHKYNFDNLGQVCEPPRWGSWPQAGVLLTKPCCSVMSSG